MITESVLNSFFKIADFLLGLLPSMEWSINTSAWGFVGDILSMVAYLLPMNYIVPLISVIIAIAGLRIGIAVIRLILNFIPFM